MSRERDIRNALQDVLEATGEIEKAWIPGLQDDRGNPTSQAFIASIEPDSTDFEELGDSAPDISNASGGGIVGRCRMVVTIAVRNEDGVIRDETAERLVNVARNIINGSTLIPGYTLPQLTRVRRIQWQKPFSVERRVRLTVEIPYEEEGWIVSDVTE